MGRSEKFPLVWKENPAAFAKEAAAGPLQIPSFWADQFIFFAA